MRIDGPYGEFSEHPEWTHYKTLVIIAGGIGVSPTACAPLQFFVWLLWIDDVVGLVSAAASAVACMTGMVKTGSCEITAHLSAASWA